MKDLKQLSPGKLVWFTFATLCAILLIIGGWLYFSLRSIEQLNQREQSRALNKLAVIDDMGQDVGQLQAAVAREVIASDLNEINLLDRGVRSLQRTNAAEFRDFQRYLDPGEERRLYDEVVRTSKSYWEQTQLVMAHSRVNEDSEAAKLINATQAPAYDHYLEAINKLIEHIEADAADSAAATTVLISKVRLVGDILVAIALLVALGTGFAAATVGRRLKEDNRHLQTEVAERRRTENMVRQSEKRYRSLFDNARDAIFTIAVDGTFTSLNPAVETIAGLSRVDWIGKPFAPMVHPDDLPLALKMFSRIMQGEQTPVHELRGNPSLKRPALMELTLTPQKDENGKIIGLLGIGRDITERKQAEAARDRLVAILESTTDLVSIADPAGRLIYLNRAGRDLRGVGLEEDITTLVIRDFLPNPDSHPVFTEGIPAAIRQGSWKGEIVIVSRGGREIPISQVILAHKNTDGKIEFTSTIMRDITERKAVEAELGTIHEHLVESSRLAGMAEIATNVLHNVGNALNSVNISTGLIVDSVKNSKASSLARVVVLFQEHAHDLGAFLANDPKGQHVPAILSRLSEHLIAEQEKIVGELDSLRRNVEHIKEIVAMQQNYATVGGLKEVIDLGILVEDSLRLNEGVFKRHGVEVVRELAKVPPMNVEKHKILQILVNLVRNAKYACDDSGRADRQLTVRMTNGDGRVKISVIDNGIGIPSENLTRIFNYGFTTRKGGHGFGLHSSALAAKEMGGSLTVRSGGCGEGADFTLELPCPTQKNSHE